MFNNGSTDRLAKAGVLAALSAVPISIGVTLSQKPLQVLCFAIGILLWLWAIALLFPNAGTRPPKSR